MLTLTNCRVWRSDRGELEEGWISLDPHSGKITAIGSTGEEDALIDPEGEVHDLNGAAVLPGLQDAHIHVHCLGEASTYIDLSACRSIEALQEVLRVAAASRSSSGWLIGDNR